MAQVESVDYNAKRIYLHEDTVQNGFDVILAHFEVKRLASRNTANGQFRIPPTIAVGNVPKTPTTYSPRYGYIDNGWRFVPYAATTHILDLKAEIVSKDAFVDSDVFDLSTLQVNVHIVSDYDAIEIREISVGGALTQEQHDQLMGLPSAQETATQVLDEVAP